MRKKFLVLSLCFTLIFSSLNYKRSYADVGIVSAPMVATILTLATASGLVLNSDSDIYNLAYNFYSTYKDNWEETKSVFNACVSIGANKVVTVGKEFKDKVVSFLDSYYSSPSVSVDTVVPLSNDLSFTFKKLSDYGDFTGKKYISTGRFVDEGSYSGILLFYVSSTGDYGVRVGDVESLLGKLSDNTTIYFAKRTSSTIYYTLYNNGYPTALSYTFDSLPLSLGGTYNPSNLGEDDLDIYVPGDVGSLVGGVDSVLPGVNSPSYDLPIDGFISFPSIDNPSINIDDTISFPVVDVPDVDVPDVDVPSEGLFASIKDFIISLVVPSDTFWTDTWGSLYNNFTNSFPMVDMDGFNELVTGEKKFPNIDINIMGVTGRVVNGDVINSIVVWLRPIIAGFMMLCLMLFNYRKIYKLIRNSEPFGGIAPGTSDFRTGISEYNKEPVIKAVDMAAEYRAWKENGGK